MFNFTTFLYMLIGRLYIMLVPLMMLLGLLWICIKIMKGFFRSIKK